MKYILSSFVHVILFCMVIPYTLAFALLKITKCHAIDTKFFIIMSVCTLLLPTIGILSYFESQTPIKRRVGSPTRVFDTLEE